MRIRLLVHEKRKNSKKVNNLKKSEMVYFCVDDPSPPYKGIRGKGSVIIREDLDFNVAIVEKTIPRYSGKLEDPTSQALLEELKKGEAVVLEISPLYFLTSKQ